MPYPVDNATAKHDLKTPVLPEGDKLLESSLCFRAAASLFQALEEPVPGNLVVLSPVYSYRDAPNPPLARELPVIGVADAALSVVRKLVGDEDDIPDCLHQCTVATKRADRNAPVDLKERDLRNANNFAKFIRLLHAEGAVAIVGVDSKQRFGILKPTLDTSTSGSFEAQDFAAACYVGLLGKVKEFVSVTTTAPVAAETNFWEPPTAENDPSSNNNGGDGGGFWEPPSSNANGDDTFDFGSQNNAAAADAWQPGGVQDMQVDEPEQKGDGDQFHADAGAAAADRFYSSLTRTLDTRANSRIYHMRAFNGWVKATQIQELNPNTGMGKKKPLRVLDLACGKGGDLGKWTLHPRKIGNYVGIDVARGSLVDAALRARKMRQKLQRCTFTCADLGSDVPGRLKSSTHKHMQKLSTWSLQSEPEHVHAISDPQFQFVRGGGIALDDKFDVVSIQFAIHYMMQTKKRARRFFQTVSELLEIEGNLIVTTIDARIVVSHLMNLGLDLHFEDNVGAPKMDDVVISVGAGACQIRFQPEVVKKIFTTKPSDSADGIDENLFGLEYTFTLVEGSDHAAGVGDAVNLPEWLIPIPVLEALAKEAGLELVYAKNFHEFYSDRKDPKSNPDAHSSLYNMKVLNRNGTISKDEFEISRLYAALKFRKVRESTMKFDDDDDDDGEEEEDDESAPIDPAVKAKFMMKALSQAKKSAGSDTWATLSSEEKNRLTDVEVRKLARG